MAFHDVRIDEDIERGARGGPRFKTTIIGVGSGFEQRNQEWQFSRGEWDISYGVDNQAFYSTLITFFDARRGRLHGFRFKDWSDFEANDPQVLGVGDNSNTDFQLVKIYLDAAATYTRKITQPVTTPTDTVSVFLDGVPQTITTDYTIEPLGIIRFVTAPVSETVTATFEFDVPVRFDTDELDLEVLFYDAASVPALNLVELRE